MPSWVATPPPFALLIASAVPSYAAPANQAIFRDGTMYGPGYQATELSNHRTRVAELPSYRARLPIY